MKNTYKIDGEYLMKNVRGDEVHVLRALTDSIRAILYFLEVGKFEINEDLYQQIYDKDRRFFKKVIK